jgi:hypothetical protein
MFYSRNNIIRLYVFGLALLSIAIGTPYLVKLWTLDPAGLSPYSGRFAEWDYVNLWLGGKLALLGRVSTIFDVDSYREFMGGFSHTHVDSQEWSYPPSILLIGAPLATIPLFPSYLVWTFGGIASLFWALRAGALPLTLCFGALVSPAMFMNVVFGQNGGFSAAFLCGGLLLLRRQPVLAGILFGLLTLKPHLGLMIPICLIAGRQWSAMASAIVAAIALAVFTAICFGGESWILFFERTAPMMRAILEAPYPQTYHASSASIFTLVRSFDGGLAVVWVCQTLAALAAGVVVWRVWRAERSDDLAAIAVTIIATFVATPYAYMYDLAAYCVAVLMLVAMTLNNKELSTSTIGISLLMLAFYWFWPVLQNAAVRHTYYQFSSIVVLLTFGYAVANWASRAASVRLDAAHDRGDPLAEPA